MTTRRGSEAVLVAIVAAFFVTLAGCVPTTSQARRALCPDPQAIGTPEGELSDVVSAFGPTAGFSDKLAGGSSYEGGKAIAEARYLYFSANIDGEFQIYRIPVGESALAGALSGAPAHQPARITSSQSGQGTSNVTPHAGATGLVAFSSNRTGNYDIFVMRPDGSGQTRLTATPGNEVGPALSPDGRAVAFTSDCHGNEDVFVASLDGKSLKRITSSPENESAPDWSPDGGTIAYKSEVDGVAHIYLADSDGANPRRLTSNDFPESAPAFSPDGTLIAYQALSRNRWQIRVAKLDGTEDRALTDSGFDDTRPRWSPDGKHIYFVSDRDGHDAVYVMAADGSDVQRLVGDSYSARSPAPAVLAPLSG